MLTQHFHSQRGCLSYITYDPKTKDAALIDPSADIGQFAYVEFLRTNGLTLRYIIETHTHADHVSLCRAMREATGAALLRHERAPSPLRDVALFGGEMLQLGGEVLHVLSTAGHTNESISLYNGAEVFTGDALLIGGTGRTDFQVGDSDALYQSLHSVIASLPSETIIRPAHDYKGRNSAILADEIRTNPRIMMSESEFVQTMNAHHPSKPELFEEAIAENSR